MGDRPAWMRPVQYTDDRFQEQPTPAPKTPTTSKPPLTQEGLRSQVLGNNDAQAARRAAFKASLSGFKSNDTTPVDYSRGPSDEVFGVDDNDYGPEPIDEVGEDGEEVA